MFLKSKKNTLKIKKCGIIDIYNANARNENNGGVHV